MHILFQEVYGELSNYGLLRSSKQMLTGLPVQGPQTEQQESSALKILNNYILTGFMNK